LGGPSPLLSVEEAEAVFFSRADGEEEEEEVCLWKPK
jgi:hypothetical protein